MSHRVVTDLRVAGRVVFCRVDFNVPLEGTTITDDRRVRASLPTVRWLAEKGAKVVCASHFARPKGKRVPEMSLAPVAKRLSELLGAPVAFAEDCVGEPARAVVSALKDGEVALLENLRFHPGEEKGDEEFARELAAEQLVQPFATTIDAGRYWLTRLMSRAESDAMVRFKTWLIEEIAATPSSPRA